MIITQGEAFCGVSLMLFEFAILPRFYRARCARSVTGFLLDVAAELEAHSGKNFAREIILTPRGEPLVEGSAQHGSRRGGFDRGQDGPTSFARVGDAAGVTFQRGLLQERNCR